MPASIKRNRNLIVNTKENHDAEWTSNNMNIDRRDLRKNWNRNTHIFHGCKEIYDVIIQWDQSLSRLIIFDYTVFAYLLKRTMFSINWVFLRVTVGATQIVSTTFLKRLFVLCCFSMGHYFVANIEWECGRCCKTRSFVATLMIRSHLGPIILTMVVFALLCGPH